MCTDKSLGVWSFQSLRRVFCLVALALTLLFALPAGPGIAQTPVPATLVQAATPMLPYLDWLIDPSGKLTVEDMAAPAQQAAFRPLNLEKMPRETGTVWLRFTLAPRVLDARPGTYLLDMGEGVPGTPTLYIPKHNVLTDTTEWQDFTPSQRSIFLMPDAQTSPVTAYIKMSGLPGLWFTPMLRTPHNAATALERLMRPAVIVVLGVVMLLCLLRSLTERGEWRFWTSLYTGAALLHSVWGVPTVLQGHVPMGEIASVLAPGVALMLLPHVGRHLMHTRDTAKIIDVQYILLSLPGAALALLPLVPGFSWTIRYLDLWPLGTLLLVPTTLGAWLMGLAGARRFLLGCLLPPLATAAGIMGIGTAVPAPLLATAPLWGVALSALLIAGTAAAQEHVEADKPEATVDPLHDPALRIVTPEELAQENAAPMPEPTLWEQNARPRIPADSTALAWEEKLRGPLDSLLREGAALAECSLPPVARQHAQALQENVRAMSTLLSQPLDEVTSSGIDNEDPAADSFFDLQQILRDAHDAVASNAENKNIALSWFMPPHLATRYVGDGRRLATCTRLLLESAVRATSRGGVQVAVRRVPESVDAGHLLFSVTDTGAGMPPHDRSSVALARAWELAAANRGFLGVECSPHGASISFTVRLQVASAHTMADSGPNSGSDDSLNDTPSAAVADAQNAASHKAESRESVANPCARPAPVAEAAASAMVGANSANPQSRRAVGDGVFVASAQARPASQSAVPRIIIADDSLSNRQLLAFFLEGLPYQAQEARSPDEVVALYVAAPAALIIFDGDMPEEDTLSAVERVRAFEATHALPAALVLALTTDESRWDALHEGGFTHALVKPLTRTGLRRTVQELLPAGGVAVPPPLGEDLLQPADTAESQSLLFPEDEAAGILLPEQPVSDASHVDTLDSLDLDDDEIIDTGEPLPDSVPASLSGSVAFDEPLSMSSADSAASFAQNAPEGLPLPLVDMPTDRPMPASAKLGGRVESADIADMADTGDTDFVESVYPYPPHATSTTGVESVKTHVQPIENAVKVDVSTVQAETPAFFRPQPAPLRGSPADNLVEWVGEATPIPKAQPVSSAAPEVSSQPVPRTVAASPVPNVTISGSVFVAPFGVSPAAPTAPSTPPVAEDSARSARLEATPKAWATTDTPSRVPDLLTPYTKASFANEADTATLNATPAPETASSVAPRSVFIPLSFESAAEGAQATPTAPVPSVPVTPAASVASENNPRAASRAERLSLIPEESPLLDFIIAPAQSASAPTPASASPAASVVHVAPEASEAPTAPLRPTTVSPVPSTPAATPPADRRPASTTPVVATPAPTGAQAETVTVLGNPTTPLPDKLDSPIPTMLEEFDEAMRYARGGFARKNIQAVHEAAVYIANRSDTCGLRVLARMARCVGEAAKAEDMEALNNLLPELETAVERNKIALLKK